jgi:hypothetical protein
MLPKTNNTGSRQSDLDIPKKKNPSNAKELLDYQAWVMPRPTIDLLDYVISRVHFVLVHKYTNYLRQVFRRFV